MELNKNDYLLLEFCAETPLSISDVSKKLNIAVKNVSARLEKLEENGLIIVKEGGRGKPTIIKTKSNRATKDTVVFLKYLREFNEKQGLPSSIEKLRKDLIEEDFQIEEILSYLQETARVGFRITKQGREFLKQNE